MTAEVDTYICKLPDAQEYIKNLMVDSGEDEDVRLHIAALCCDAQGVAKFVKEKGAWKALNHGVRPFLAPPLRLAVNGGDETCLRLLVEAGANLEQTDIKGQTPLFVATSLRKSRLMQILLEAGANPEGSRLNRGSPLSIAVRDGFADGVKILLEYGAETEPLRQINTCVPSLPLQHAVVYAHFNCFLALIQGGASPDLKRVQVSSAIKKRLAIPRAIFKYAGDNPEFVFLYYESGGSMSVDDESYRPNNVSDADDQSKAISAFMRLAGVPLRLLSLSRIYIRKLYANRQIRDQLDIPNSLKAFLNFEEFYKYSIRTVENIHVKAELS